MSLTCSSIFLLLMTSLSVQLDQKCNSELLATDLDGAETNSCVQISQRRHCEELNVPICKKFNYNYTSMPNTLGHDNQEEAALELHQFSPLIKVRCSPDLTNFLCSVYAPPCVKDQEKSVQPCKSLCDRVRNGCEPLMLQYGFNWPTQFDCQNFSDVRPCIGYDTSSSSTETTTVAQPLQETSIPNRNCERITIPLCKNLSYNFTSKSNVLGHENQEEASLEVHQFWPLIEIKCSSDLRLFVCSIYAPPCLEDQEEVVQPCKSLCEQVRSDCEPLMLQYGFNWPTQFDCQNFSDTQPCMDSEGFSTISENLTVTQNPQHININHCESITVAMCSDLDYNITYMPNTFGHNNQEEAGLEIHQFWPLVAMQCSADLQLFLCSMYVPPCVNVGKYPESANNTFLRPCRSLCERARNGCESLLQQVDFIWPEKFECDNFPTSATELCIGN